MAINEYNSDLDIKGRLFSNNVPNSTGSIVTWNATTNVFGLRTNAQIISDLNLSSNFVPYTGATANVNLGTRSITSTGGFIGNAITATTLATARTINGTSFNGSANITTALWGTARNITIGNTTKAVNGSANVSWSLAEIGVTTPTLQQVLTAGNESVNSGSLILKSTANNNNQFVSRYIVKTTGGWARNGFSHTILNNAETENLSVLRIQAYGSGENVVHHSIGTGSYNSGSTIRFYPDERLRIYLDNSERFRLTDTEVRFSALNTAGFVKTDNNGFLSVDTNTYALASSIPTSSDYITTNTTQTGLSGNKTTSGWWAIIPNNSTGITGSQIPYATVIRRSGGDYGSLIEGYDVNGDQGYVLRSYEIGSTSQFELFNGTISSQGYKKYGQSNSSVLLAGGGHRPVSDFALASSIVTPNNGLLTISTSADLTGGGTFSADQATASNVAIGLSAGTLASLALADSALQSGDNVSELVNDAGYITASSLPNVGNGNITYSGIGDITGGGTSTANQSGNTDYTFDLTAQTKSNIQLGVTAHGWGNHSLLNYWKNDYMRSRYVGASVITDINSALPDGGFISSYSSTSWAGSDRPSGASYGGAIRFQGDQNNNNNNALDIYYNNGHGDNPARFWLRTMGQGSIATPWREIWHTGNFNPSDYALVTQLPTVNNGQLSLSTGTGLSGSATFTANQSGSSSFSVAVASTHKLPTTTEWNALSTQTLSSSTSNLIVSNTVQRAALTGDVTASQNSNVTTIANSAVTHAKYQNIATQRILGRGATGTGNVQELTLGANLSLSTTGVLSATNTNTTYSAGTGLSLSGTTFGQAITTSGSGTYVQSITQTASGFQVNLGTPPNTNTTYSAGTLALLTAGTNQTNRVWRADYLNQGIKALTYNPDNLTFGSGLNYNTSTGVLTADLDSIFAYSTQGGLYTTNWSSNALGQYSLAIGHASNATAQNATAVGSAVFTGGFGSTNVGFSSNVNKSLAGNFGTYNTNNHRESFTYGLGLQSASTWQTVMGRYNKPNGAGDIDDWTDIRNPIFILGVGQDEMNRKNSVSAFGDGRLDYETDRDDTHWTPNTLPDIRWIQENISGGGGSSKTMRIDQNLTQSYTSSEVNGLVSNPENIVSLPAYSDPITGSIQVLMQNEYGNYTSPDYLKMFNNVGVYVAPTQYTLPDILVNRGVIFVTNNANYLSQFNNAYYLVYTAEPRNNYFSELVWLTADELFMIKNEPEIVAKIIGNIYQDSNNDIWFNVNPQIL